jgi:YebC/PmpR family DNA-binding regulatory protein
MSGHSKWSTIKHKKAIKDAKKGKIFSKLSQLITHAARQGGGDPNMNPSLRLLLDQAKAEGFPADNVQRAIDKGTGEGAGVALTEASYEGVGPGKISIIVDVLTDNTNRVVSDLRKLFSDVGGNLGETGSVSWNFEVKGYVKMRPGKLAPAEKFGQPDVFVPGNRDEIEIEMMDIEGITDIEDGQEGSLDIYTEFKDMGKVRDAILAKGYVVTQAQIVKMPKMYKDLSGEEYEKAVNALEQIEEYEDVQNVWTDLNVQ